MIERRTFLKAVGTGIPGLMGLLQRERVDDFRRTQDPNKEVPPGCGMVSCQSIVPGSVADFGVEVVLPNWLDSKVMWELVNSTNTTKLLSGEPGTVRFLNFSMDLTQPVPVCWMLFRWNVEGFRSPNYLSGNAVFEGVELFDRKDLRPLFDWAPDPTVFIPWKDQGV